MGAPAGAGGSDKSDEKKVDTYADQLKKEQARKSKFKIDKFGYKVKKNPIERYVENSPVMRIVGNTADKLNLNRRMKFANKTGVNIQGLSTEEILSKDFKSQLDAKGYTRETPTGNNNGGNDNNNQPAPTILKKTAGGQTVQTTAPTEAELSQSAAADAEAYDLRKTKKRGRSMTTLTSSKGLTDDKLTLGKKSLLGS
jgi:hypothetical protein